MSPDADLRQSPRYPADPQVRCELVVGKAVIVAQAIHNLSARGCRLSLGLFVPSETEGTARFTDRAERLSCQRAFRVVYCYDVFGRDYATGLAFQQDLAPDELERLKGLAPPELAGLRGGTPFAKHLFRNTRQTVWYVEEATNDITRYRDPNRQAQEYNRLLGEAKEISQKSLERLRELNRRFGFADSILLELEGLEGGKTRREGTPAAYPPPAGRRVCTGTPPAQEVGR